MLTSLVATVVGGATVVGAAVVGTAADVFVVESVVASCVLPLQAATTRAKGKRAPAHWMLSFLMVSSFLRSSLRGRVGRSDTRPG
jgi:hypothetical protein